MSKFEMEEQFSQFFLENRDELPDRGATQKQAAEYPTHFSVKKQADKTVEKACHLWMPARIIADLSN
jgi:hypothetical protein